VSGSIFHIVRNVRGATRRKLATTGGKVLYASRKRIVEPVIGQTIPTPKPLADAIASGGRIVRIAATMDAVTKHL
jgi:hypothetical protein